MYKSTKTIYTSTNIFGNIGMGTVHTWHGTPDARVRGAEVVYRRETDETYEVSQAPSDDESDAASDGATTVEAKVMTKDANLHQTGLSSRALRYPFSRTTFLHRGLKILEAMLSITSLSVFLRWGGRTGHGCDLLQWMNFRASECSGLAPNVNKLLADWVTYWSSV